jgi:hypothetical protein
LLLVRQPTTCESTELPQAPPGTVSGSIFLFLSNLAMVNNSFEPPTLRLQIANRKSKI